MAKSFPKDPRYLQRKEIMLCMRNRARCSDTQIALVFNLSRERVRQILGNSRKNKNEQKRLRVIELFKSEELLPEEIMRRMHTENFWISSATVRKHLKELMGGRAALQDKLFKIRKARVGKELRAYADLHPENGLNSTMMERIDKALYDKAIKLQSLFDWRRELNIPFHSVWISRREKKNGEL